MNHGLGSLTLSLSLVCKVFIQTPLADALQAT